MNTKRNRIMGYDFARGLAIIGMIFVNFKVVMVKEGNSHLYHLIEFFSGKAAALFVVLAGAGMTLMYQGAKSKNGSTGIRKIKFDLLKRSVFLFIIGLCYYFIWPADILHYYGLYISIGVLFLSLPRKWLLPLSLFIIVAYSLLFPWLDYEKGWNWTTLAYSDFFTLEGFFRNLFLNGFHPVFPWLAFLVVGIWVGGINFKDLKTRKTVLLISLLIYLTFQGISYLLVSTLSTVSPNEIEEISFVFGTSPMPPLFFYMITASSLAIVILTLSIYIAEKFTHTLFVRQLSSMGQLALSNYFLHVIIGMVAIEVFFGQLEQAFSIEFTVIYASGFSLLLLLFSYLWRKKFKRGPLEYIMRRITG